MSSVGWLTRRATYRSVTAIALLMATSMPLCASAPADDPLASLQRRYRVVLVFAPADDDPRLQRQQAILEALGPAADERDLIVVSVVGARTFGERLALDPAELRQRFDVAAADFRVLLVGKDGGVKLRADAPVEHCALLGMIDAMPMRQRESSHAARPHPECALPVDRVARE